MAAKIGKEEPTVRTRLQELRKGAHHTQESFSQIVKISRSYYSQIESGEKDPSLKVCMRIKQALNYPYDDIFFNPKRPKMGQSRE